MSKTTPATDSTSKPVALVTGASRRIGRAICEHLHAEGFNIVVHYNSSLETAKQLANKLNTTSPNSALTLQADLNDSDAVVELATHAQDAWGRMDVLVNNASKFYPTPVGAVNEHHWDDLFASNCKAPFFLAQALAKDLKKVKGAIINLLDIHVERPMPNHTIYCMAKTANRMMTQSLALELAPHVRVNGVAPGAAMWPEDNEGTEKINLEKLQTIPLKKLGGADAIAKTVCFLVKNANYITGQTINVDGGKTLLQI